MVIYYISIILIINIVNLRNICQNPSRNVYIDDLQHQKKYRLTPALHNPPLQENYGNSVKQVIYRFPNKPVMYSSSDYPELAEETLRGEIPGSSAGGEQPKFTVFCRDCPGHVIVKFSPEGTHAHAKRWRDILITEYHASKVLFDHGYPSADIVLSDIKGRLFLESKRFDRNAEQGRRSMLSLRSIDNEFTGIGHGWPRILGALFKRDLVPWQAVVDTEIFWHFGKLINNIDMHPGNLSFAMENDGFRLLPVYDMCAMGFAPKSGGEAPPFIFNPMAPNFIHLTSETHLDGIKKMAYDFWERVEKDERLSFEFRCFLKKNTPVKKIENLSPLTR